MWDIAVFGHEEDLNSHMKKRRAELKNSL